MKKNIIILIAFLIISGFLGIAVGQKNCLELILYHYYNVYSFLTDRTSQDILAAGLQANFNPLLDIPFYLLSQVLMFKPKLFVFVQSLYGGIIMFLIYKISDLIFKKPGLEKLFFMAFSVVIGTSGFVYLLELGDCQNDIQAGIFSLITLYLLLTSIYKPISKKRTLYVFIAGLSLGIGVGLKLTLCIFALSFLLCLIFLRREITSPLKAILYFFLGCAVGFVAVDGYWLFYVYSHYKNPFFPLLNNIFKSELAPYLSYTDQRFVPASIYEYLLFPISWIGKMGVSDFEFFDLRYIAAYVYVVIFWITTIFFKIKHKVSDNKINVYIDSKYQIFILLYVSIAYILWVKMYSILRYLLPIEILTGIIISMSLCYILILFKNKFAYFFTIIFLSIIIICTTLHPKVSRQYGDKLFEVEDLKIPDDSVVFLCGIPTSMITVFQNPKAHYVFLYGDQQYDFNHSEKSLDKINNLVKKHNKNKYAIIQYTFSELQEDKISRYGNLDKDSCRLIKKNISFDAYFCKLN